jgi:hypothetical protein
MRDVIESASGDGKGAIVKNDAGLPIDTAHWTGPWVAEKPSAQHDRAEASRTRPTLPAKRDGPREPSRAGRRPRRFIPLASGVAAALLLLLVPRNADRPGSGRVGELALLPGEAPTVTGAMLPRSNPEPEALRLLRQEQAGAVAQELAEARSAIATLNAQLRADAARSEQALRQEQDKTAAQTQEAAAARQELIATVAQHRQALDGERAQRTALADQLLASQRDLQALAMQLRGASDEVEQLKQAETAKTARSLEQERQKTVPLAQELAALRQELGSITAQHRQALDQERAQRAALAVELSGAQREAAAQAAQLRKASDEMAQLKQVDAAKTGQLLEQERQKTAAFAQAAAARQALTASTAQHRQGLDEERAQRAALTAELAAARRDVEMQAVQLRKASEEAGLFRQAEAVRAAQSLDLERQKTVALAQAAAARQEQAANTAQHRQALDRERAQRTALAAELSVAQREIEVQAVQLRKVSNEADQLRHASEGTIVELRQTLQQERDRAATLAQELASLRPVTAGRAIAEPVPASAGPKAPQAVAVAAAGQPVAAEPRNSPDAARLLARASALLGQGDIGSARIVLERAVETGSARASFMLAETYDPRILSAWGTYGTRGEVTRARELYARAQSGGIPEAKDRVEALAQAPDG